MSASKALPFVLVLAGLLLVPRLAWMDREPVELSLGIAGPPAGPAFSYPPPGLTWILDHMKARPVGREAWGVGPGELTPAGLRGLSVVYLSGGLARSAGASEGLEEESDSSSRVSDWMHGSDGRALSAFVSRGGAAVAEGGLLPTVLDPEARWRVEECFRVRWTGWVGLTVDDIGDPSETPRWIVKKLQEAGEMVPSGGPAVIFLKGERAIVLRADLELIGDVHEIVPVSEEGWAADLSSRVPYKGWFDIVDAMGGAEVLAEHRLHVTDWGAQKLAAADLSESFPCLIRYQGAHVSYYVSVALSQEGPSEFWVPVAGYPQLASAAAGVFWGKRAEAFWRFYYPVVRNIVLEASVPRPGIGT
jgi:hypothetical protein